MTRSEAREIAMHFTFEMSFLDLSAEELIENRFSSDYFLTLAEEYELYTSKPNKKQMDYIKQVVRGVYKHAPELDAYIQKYSIGWEFDRISRVFSAIMRLCMYEILYMPGIPNGAAINEAVNLTKKYEDEAASSFINGILGSFVRGELPQHD